MTAPVLPSVEEGLNLVRRHQAGDPDAFAEIYRANYPTVYRFAARRLSNRQLAEDFAQETFCKAFARLATDFECRDKAIGAWLVTICRNLVADHFKKASTGRFIPVDIVPEHSVDPLQRLTAPSADAQVLADLDRAEILAAMPALTKPQQRAIELRFFGELSVAEAAAEMGLTDAALKTLVFRAVQALSRRMNRRRWPS